MGKGTFMETQTLTAEPVADLGLVPAESLFPISLGVYHKMIEYGLLTEHDKVVLLDGMLVKKMTRYPPHVRATNRTFRAMSALLREGWDVRKEDPILLPTPAAGRDSQPEPDVFVVRGGPDDLPDRHPGPADIALVVEVADSSLREDRKALARYAWAAIPVAWLVNLNARTIEVHTRPTGPTEPAQYQDVTIYGEADEVPVVLDGREVGRIAARDVLP
jgi:hypothetical protein